MAYFGDPSSYASTLFGAPFVRRRPSPPPTTVYPRETYDPYVRALAEEQAARSALQDAIRREREARQRRAEEEAKAHIRERVRRQEEAQARARQRQRPQSFYGFPFGYPQHQFGVPDFGGYGNYEDEGEDGDEATTYPYSWYSSAPRREPVRRPQTQAPPKAPRLQSRSPVYHRQQSQSSAERRNASSPKVSIPITTPSSTPAHPEASPEEQNAAASRIQAAYQVHASLSSIKAARERFTSLLYAFTFPRELDFDLSSPPKGDERPKLAYTSRNAPVHAHEDALIKLLQTLDAVESHGDVHVREARRELVREVEKELGRIDTAVRRAWDEVQSKLESEFAPAPATVEDTVIDVPIAPETIAPSEPVFVDQKEASETMHIDTEARAPTPSTIDEPTFPVDAKMDDMPTELSSVSNPIDTETVTASSQPEAPLKPMDVESEPKSRTEPEGETRSEPYILFEDDTREVEDITTALEPSIEEDSNINPNPENANLAETSVDSGSEEVIRTPPTPHVSLPLSQPTICSEAEVPALVARSSRLQEPGPEPKLPSVTHQTTVEDITDVKDEDEFVVL